MSTPLIGPVTAMVQELEKLRTEANQFKTEYLHSLAEFDNFRRRKERETCEFREYAHEALLAELVPVLENFDRALQAAEKAIDAQAGSESSAENGIRKGLQLIHNQLMDVLKKVGFVEYSCVGEEFDPRRAEAIGSLETDGQPEHSVIAESAKGYQYKSRVLRAAKVIVAKKKVTE